MVNVDVASRKPYSTCICTHFPVGAASRELNLSEGGLVSKEIS